MDKVIINIGDKAYTCQVARLEEDRHKGLQDITHLAPDEGMLFIWEEEGDHEMWMKNTKIPLDQIGINDDDEVNLVYTAQPESEELIKFPNSKYILEVNANSGIVEGDEFEIDDSDDPNKYVMKILAPDGSTQMYLQGGERIFRRGFTKQIIKWAKKAESVKSDTAKYEQYCKRLGKLIFKELKAQDEREPEYVEVKK